MTNRPVLFQSASHPRKMDSGTEVILKSVERRCLRIACWQSLEDARSQVIASVGHAGTSSESRTAGPSADHWTKMPGDDHPLQRGRHATRTTSQGCRGRSRRRAVNPYRKHWCDQTEHSSGCGGKFWTSSLVMWQLSRTAATRNPSVPINHADLVRKSSQLSFLQACPVR